MGLMNADAFRASLRDGRTVYYRAACMWPEMFAYQFIVETEITALDDDVTKGPGD